MCDFRPRDAGGAVAWEYSTGEAARPVTQPFAFEATPLVLDDVMYLSTPLGRVIALEAETGRERWAADLRVPPLSLGDFTTRGVALWADPALRRPKSDRVGLRFALRHSLIPIGGPIG